MFMQIIWQGHIHFGQHKSLDYEDVIGLFSRILRGQSRENALDILKSGVRTTWLPHDDLINPYGDDRVRRMSLVDTLWTVDIDEDIIVSEKADRSCRQIRLSRFFNGPITDADFEQYTPSVPQVLVERIFTPPYWTPDLPVSERRLSFVQRLLEDFQYQWRHILRNRYNDLTFRRLSMAIFRLITMQFDIVENNAPRQAFRHIYVSLHDLPRWKPLVNCSHDSGSFRIILSQDPKAALDLLRKESGRWKGGHHFRTTSTSDTESCYYLIFCVRHIFACKMKNGTFAYTRPARLLDGLSPPSNEAMKLLLFATQSPVAGNPIHNLPIELQDEVLCNVSVRKLRGAQVGCLLELGSPFLWREDNRDIQLQYSRTNRTKFSPVEQEIWFGDTFSGLVYK